MSNQAGIWHFDGKPVAHDQFDAFERHLTFHGPDARGEHHEIGLAMLYRAFFITAEDSLEKQPIVNANGMVLIWDGRLDNRDELLASLDRSPQDLPTDASLVNAVLLARGTGALRNFLGQWALTWWNSRERRLVLARDYIGLRKLYYLVTKASFYWSSDLSSLILHSGGRFTLCDEYFAGYFTSYPESHLTPYAEAQLVPVGSYLEITQEKIRAHRYWSFNSTPEVRYRSDRDYEDHFRHLFRQSVRRELRTCYPIRADLSGGFDSSSIVCMAYDILKAGEAHATINTLSYYSIEEPGGDERPWIKAVEAFIGTSGTLIELRSKRNPPLQPLRNPYFAALPGYFDQVLDNETILLANTAHQYNRVHLCGLGGDELLGGVPNPIPQLASLMWHLRFPLLFKELIEWALQRKTTVWSLAIRSLISLAPIGVRAHLDPTVRQLTADWLRPEFVKRQHIRWRSLRITRDQSDWLPGPATPDSTYLALAASIAGYLPRFSYSDQTALPYYDRDLVQYLLAIPEDQVLRAKQRRSLMRRALKGIVPEAVLTRTSKWIGRRQPALELLDSASMLSELLPGTPFPQRYIDPAKVENDFEKLRQGREVPLLLLERLVGACFLYTSLDRANLWQRSTRERRDPIDSPYYRTRPSSTLETSELAFDHTADDCSEGKRQVLAGGRPPVGR